MVRPRDTYAFAGIFQALSVTTTGAVRECLEDSSQKRRESGLVQTNCLLDWPHTLPYTLLFPIDKPNSTTFRSCAPSW